MSDIRVPLRNGRAIYADADRWQGRVYVQIIDAKTNTVEDEWPTSLRSAADFVAIFNTLGGVRVVSQ